MKKVQNFVKNLEKSISNKKSHSPIIVIGMRGVGKTFLSKSFANNKNLHFFDLDEEIEKRINKTISEFVFETNWAAFRVKETQVFLEILNMIFSSTEYNNSVIACGGGIIETIESQLILKGLDNVIWLERPAIDEIEHELKITNSEHRPALGNSESFQDCYMRRKKLYENLAKSVFTITSFNETEKENVYNKKQIWERIIELFKKHIKRAVFNESSREIVKENTFFLCLGLENVINLHAEDFFYINRNYEILEIRIDSFMNLNKNNEELENCVENVIEKIRNLISYLKFWIDIPLLLTLRTKNEGGDVKISNEMYKKIIFELLKTHCFDFVDIENGFLDENSKLLSEISKDFHYARIIISRHYIIKSKEEQIQSEFLKICEKALENSNIFAIKLILSENVSDLFILKLREEAISKGLLNIIFKLGENGKMSRTTNSFLTPVFDDKFSSQLAKGQLTKMQITHIQKLTGIFPQKQHFFIIGNNVENSLSPEIHNLFFKILGLTDYFYSKFQLKNIENFENLLENKRFCGFSITIPFKKEVLKYVTRLSPLAKKLQVVNTIVKCQGIVFGFNTDFYGIYKPLSQRLKKSKKNNLFGLILGAGATAETAFWVFLKLGIFPVVFNRSVERFKNFENIFWTYKREKVFVNQIEMLKDFKFDVIVNTIPGEDFIFPEFIFEKNSIVFECGYFNKETKFVIEAKKKGVFQENIIYGKEMLVYQALKQSILFTGKKICLKKIIKTFLFE